jgi:glycosyltransferase involved in cell wall biosynthesis
LIRRVAVIVPAANEEATIGRCLASVAAARSTLYRCDVRAQVAILVVLDGCTDATAAIAAQFSDARPIVIGARNVGAARQAGAAAALRGGRPSETWLASTDADSEVPADWLSRMTALARQGAHLVLGTVLPGDSLDPAVRAAWLARHRLREGHPHVHGANLGIRGDAYLALGGWTPRATGEDADLARRAAAASHLHIIRTATIPVVTSPRVTARAPGGFASYLRGVGWPGGSRIRETTPGEMPPAPPGFVRGKLAWGNAGQPELSGQTS